MTTCDLFAGAGGLSIGFEESGFTPLFYNDFDEAAGETFTRHFANTPAYIGPVEDLNSEDVLRRADLRKGELDVLIGGPPCQGFSINAPERSPNDPRNHLFLHFVRFLRGLKPKIVVMENVPGLYSFRSGETLKDVIEAFQREGYRTAYKILNAAHYGVPQERWRLVIIGTRLADVKLSFPAPVRYSIQRPNFAGGRELTFRHAIRNGHPDLFVERLDRFTSIEQAVGDLPPLKSGARNEVLAFSTEPQTDFQRWARRDAVQLYNHSCSGLSKINLKRLQYIQQGGSWRDIPYELLPEGMKRARRSDHTRRYGRMDPDGTSFTIMTKCDPHWGTYFHYNQERVISVREAARLQSFPDRIRFYGSLSDQYRQVGNAVPPLMAKAIAKHIATLLDSRVRKLIAA